jgi:protein-S-isoprenylcysteine O-methyltransferase Ste14
MRELLRKHGQTILNVVLVVALGHYAIQRGAEALRQAWFERRIDAVETAFFLHNVIMLGFILFRRQHEAIDRNLFHQAVALVAFFSGMAFISAAPPGRVLLRVSQAVAVIAALLGMVSLVNLGRSFGILVSIRKVKTSGLYAVIRHPMYFTDILWRVGITLKNPCPVNAVFFLVSSGCYVYRGLLEERYLSQWPEYREYMQKVRYRFLPGIF